MRIAPDNHLIGALTTLYCRRKAVPAGVFDPEEIPVIRLAITLSEGTRGWSGRASNEDSLVNAELCRMRVLSCRTNNGKVWEGICWFDEWARISSRKNHFPRVLDERYSQSRCQPNYTEVTTFE